MACGDVLSLEDLQTAKKHQIFEAEVITGKVGGVAGGATIDTATNPVTGQIQQTLPSILADLGFDVQPWTSSTGGVLASANQVFLNDTSGSLGIGDYYAWSGTFPKTVPAGTDPALPTSGYIMRSSRFAGTQAREALRRIYAGVGRNLVDGSFEAGGTLVNANDVLLQERTGKAFSGPAGTVAAGTNPASGGFVDVSNSLRHVLFSSAFGLAPSNSASKNSKAMRDLASAAMALGTAKIIFEKGDYIVGEQYLTGAYFMGGAWRPLECFKVTGMKRLDIEFDGCKFKWVDGMRFGAFDPVTGEPVVTDSSNVTTPSYRSDKGMVFDIRDNDQVNISGNIEIDGNTENTILGGWWSRLNERQNWDYGIYAKDNRQYNDTAVKYFHSSSCDGYAFTGSLTYNASFDISNLVAVYCGRNGLSFTGGINGSFNNIVAGYSGYKNLSSLPAAAIDVEPEASSRISGVSMNNIICLPSRGPALQGAYYVTPNNTSIIEDITFNNLKTYGVMGMASCLRWVAQNTKFNKSKFFGSTDAISSVDGLDGLGGKIIFDDCDFYSRFDNEDRSYGYRDIATIIQMNDDSKNVLFKDCRGYADITVSHPTAIKANTAAFDGFDLRIDGYFNDANRPSLATMWVAYLNYANLKRFNIVNNLITEFSAGVSDRFGVAAFRAKVDDCYISLGQHNNESIVWNTNKSTGQSGRYVQGLDNSEPAINLTYRNSLTDIKTRSISNRALKLYDVNYINLLDVGISRGDLLTVADFSTGGKQWYKCTSPGTATTRTTTALGTISLNSTTVTLSTLDGLKVGDYIKIGTAYGGFAPRILRLDPIAMTATLNYGAGASVTNAPVTFPAPVFE